MPGYIKVDKKKFDQDTIRSANGYRMLLSPPNILSIIEKEKEKVCCTDKDTTLAEILWRSVERSKELHNWRSENLLTQLCNHFMDHIGLDILWSHFSKYMNNVPSATLRSTLYQRHCHRSVRCTLSHVLSGEVILWNYFEPFMASCIRSYSSPRASRTASVLLVIYSPSLWTLLEEWTPFLQKIVPHLVFSGYCWITGRCCADMPLKPGSH